MNKHDSIVPSKKEEFDNMTDEKKKEIEGYAYCSSKKEKCLNDCWWGIGGKASVVDIN